jgi:hypothetical protein
MRNGDVGHQIRAMAYEARIDNITTDNDIRLECICRCVCSDSIPPRNCDTLNLVSHYVDVENFVGYMLPSTLRIGGIVSSQAGGRDNHTVDQVPRGLAFFQRGEFES